MKTYLVGGAVRDFYLGKPVKDRDFVVVGGTAQELLDQGFEQVGMGFPVFLHPQSGEEYALARREKKVGAGYTGFEFETTEDVTLHDDLFRRDLTMNSMAMEGDQLVDPFGGMRDLKEKVLRHTSAAFGEDPLRVVRLARFYSRYSKDGFTVAPETMSLAADMVHRGDLNELPYERFWRELEKAFEDGSTWKFFELLFEVGAFEHVNFFKDLFGQNVNGMKLGRMMRTATECGKLGDAGFALEVFAGLVTPENVQNFFHTARAANIQAGMTEYNNLGSHPTGVEFTKFLTKCRAWGQGTMADDVVTAIRVVETAHAAVHPHHPAWVVRAAIDAGRSVSSDPYQHLDGKAIGEAMFAERVRRITKVLGN